MKYDTVIVGAGSAGGILAARLSEQEGHRVLLLEAGPDYPNLDDIPKDVRDGHSNASDQTIRAEHNWHYHARMNSFTQPVKVPRGRLVGGSSAINAVIFLRGEPADYDSWANSFPGSTGEMWSFQKLLPIMRELETDQDFPQSPLHGNSGLIHCHRYPPEQWLPTAAAFYRAARELGFDDCKDHNHPESSGIGPVPVNLKQNNRMSTAVTYIHGARGRENLSILSGCTVHRVLFDQSQEKPRACGVEISLENEEHLSVIEADDIILAAGAIGTPHILLNSGVGPKSDLEKHDVQCVRDTPGVGQNLRDHPTVRLEYQLKGDWARDSFEIPDQMCLRWTARDSQDKNDLIIFASRFDIGMASGLSASPSGQLGLRWRARVNLAYSSGHIRLASNTIHQPPDINYNFLSNTHDTHRLRQALRTASRLAEHPAFSNLLGDRLSPKDIDVQSDAELDEWMQQTVTSGHHICGTCKMGPSTDGMAVVDQHGKVHGIDNLRVADASIMPDCIRANTNLSALLIGENMAKIIATARQ